LGSESEFSIFGYDYDESPVELVHSRVGEKEKIIYVGFIDDERP
jgi:hypothetical protein